MRETIQSGKIRRPKRAGTVADIISGTILLLMLYTATSKLLGFNKFSMTIHRSPLLRPVAPLVVWFVIIAELTISTLLIVPRTRLAGLRFASILLLAFTAYLGYMVAFSPNLPCSCGGVISSLPWKGHIVLNLLATCLCLTGIWLYKTGFPQGRSPPKQQETYL